MKKFVLISPKNRTAYNFRGDLLKDIISKGYDVIVTGPNLDDVDKIEALGAKFVEIPMNKNGINPFSDLRYIWKLYQLMRRLKPVATLGYTIKPVIYGAIAAKLAGVKNISSMVTGAGYLFTASCTKARVLKTISQILYRIGFGCADHVIFQNDDDLKEFTVHRLCKRSKCNVVNGSGVNMYKFKPQPYPEKVSFFMLGRMLYSKGILEYIEAAKVVKKRYPNIRFMVLGKFEQMQDAIDESVVKPYINEGIVEYFPETSNVLQYYGQCSVFVLPSYREGTPRSVLEAMACSRAIITTDVPGCRSTVNDGKNGFLVPKQNIDALAVAMCKFIEMPNLIQEMGKASYDLCQAKFEVSRVNQSMLKIMDI